LPFAPGLGDAGTARVGTTGLCDAPDAVVATMAQIANVAHRPAAKIL
jgi:hypothetical protein